MKKRKQLWENDDKIFLEFKNKKINYWEKREEFLIKSD